MASSRLSKETNCFSRLSRRTSTHWFCSMSLGPISSRRGTPCISYWAYFQPGELSLASSFTRNFSESRFCSSWAFSSTPGLCMATGTITTWMGAIFGGSTRPLSSPWTIITAPIIRVETPQEV